jgi:hypothetical protein
VCASLRSEFLGVCDADPEGRTASGCKAGCQVLNARNPPGATEGLQRRASHPKGGSEAPFDAPKTGGSSTLFRVECRKSSLRTKEKKNDRLDNNAEREGSRRNKPG